MDALGHNFHGSWRHPDARNREFKGFDLWMDLANKAEQAKVDALFCTDVMGVQGQCRRATRSSSSIWCRCFRTKA